jgi:hypothetical protein
MKAAISFWNVCKLPPDYKASDTRKLSYLQSPPWQPLISRGRGNGGNGEQMDNAGLPEVVRQSCRKWLAVGGHVLRVACTVCIIEADLRPSGGELPLRGIVHSNSNNETSWFSAVTQATGCVPPSARYHRPHCVLKFHNPVGTFHLFYVLVSFLHSLSFPFCFVSMLLSRHTVVSPSDLQFLSPFYCLFHLITLPFRIYFLFIIFILFSLFILFYTSFHLSFPHIVSPFISPARFFL